MLMHPKYVVNEKDTKVKLNKTGVSKFFIP